ncbi:MAG: hypothetical protein MUD08_08870 [Cytophagales bacterium]|jgi:uncharacterized protein YfaP (DUF2135 family)|nr:hypothetical protein [Cytophagales bacterium]
MRNTFTILLLLALGLVFDGCRRREEEPPRLTGAPGNPRFNLKFTNEANVDLDLYVKDPNGEIIYFANKIADRSTGQLDVDCLCGNCNQGPNENIFWTPGTAPVGRYEVWVQYYGSCRSGTNTSSDFTLYVTQNERILQTYTGTLTPTNRKSTVWTHQQN